jgi:hypothetical protein
MVLLFARARWLLASQPQLVLPKLAGLQLLSDCRTFTSAESVLRARIRTKPWC